MGNCERYIAHLEEMKEGGISLPKLQSLEKTIRDHELGYADFVCQFQIAANLGDAYVRGQFSEEARSYYAQESARTGSVFNSLFIRDSGLLGYPHGSLKGIIEAVAGTVLVFAGVKMRGTPQRNRIGWALNILGGLIFADGAIGGSEGHVPGILPRLIDRLLS